MSKRVWYDNDSLDKWVGGALLVALAFSGPGVIMDAVYRSSLWHSVVLLAWIVAVTGLVMSALLRWSRRRNTAAVSVERRDPDTVPTEAVKDAIASSPSRIAAVKLLRERVPGLRLGDAAYLIDAHLQARPEH